jgi:hypothetical protein
MKNSADQPRQTIPELSSPIESMDSRHHIEVPASTQKRKPMLPAERRNPQVIGGNRLSGLSQLSIDSRVVMSSLPGDIQHLAVLDQAVQPTDDIWLYAAIAQFRTEIPL